VVAHDADAEHLDVDVFARASDDTSNGALRDLVLIHGPWDAGDHVGTVRQGKIAVFHGGPGDGVSERTSIDNTGQHFAGGDHTSNVDSAALGLSAKRLRARAGASYLGLEAS
jgi:hypothetical protein